jgi:uncharacterized protein YqiB (DUF1249 family)
MLPSHEQVGHHRPQDFSRLMDQYAEIYRQLELMFDDLDLAHDRYMSCLAGELPIYIEITERHRYTTIARMTYFIEDPSGAMSPDPDAHIRIYHDARLAEATHCYPGTVSQPLFGSLVPISDVVEHRWRTNLFFDRWLGYLLGQGHGLNSLRQASSDEWPPESMQLSGPWWDSGQQSMREK